MDKPKDRATMDEPQSVSFQIANGNMRQACIVQTTCSTQEQAKKYFLMNWPTIERMARDAVAAGDIEDGQIKLVMI
jgi:hypothetical protein